MTKTEMIKAISEITGVTRAEVGGVLNALPIVIQDELGKTGRIEIAGLGTFKVVTRKATMRPNPQKPGEKVAVPAKQVVSFKPSLGLKEAVNA